MRIRHSEKPCAELLSLRQTPSKTNTLTRAVKTLGRKLMDAKRIFQKLNCTSAHSASALNRKPGNQFQPAIDTISASETLRRQLLKGNTFCTKSQDQQVQNIVARSATVEIDNDNPLFTFPNLAGVSNLPPALVNMGPIARPGHAAKLVVADLYRKKYGVQILIQKDPIDDARQLARLLLHKVNAANGKALGFVLHANRCNANAQPLSDNSRDYRGHVLPVIAQRSANGIEIINLNSVRETASELEDALCSIQGSGLEVKVLKLNIPQRQADGYSCHTDALQVLKDALISQTRTRKSLHNDYLEKYGIPTHLCGQLDAADEFLSTRFINMPPHLQKTVQRSQALASSRMTFKEAMATQVPSWGHRKKQTLGEHRQRYSALIPSTGKTVNHFLLFKGYRNAFKVLGQLESLQNMALRKQYLQRTTMQHQLDQDASSA
jgi:hypothetical protein